MLANSKSCHTSVPKRNKSRLYYRKASKTICMNTNYGFARRLIIKALTCLEPVLGSIFRASGCDPWSCMDRDFTDDKFLCTCFLRRYFDTFLPLQKAQGHDTLTTFSAMPWFYVSTWRTRDFLIMPCACSCLQRDMPSHCCCFMFLWECHARYGCQCNSNSRAGGVALANTSTSHFGNSGSLSSWASGWLQFQ